MLNLPKTIKWVITDFDGIVTDNFVYVNEDCSMTRRINFKDVIGFNNLYKHGINVAIISGETNSIINLLASKFELKEVHTKIHNKLDMLKSIISKYNLTQEDYVYCGDDINDAECLQYAKYRITVPQAVEKIRRIENIQITEANGGYGAFREVADCLTD